MLNFLATCRAIYTYSRCVITKEALTWSKTDHDFPTQLQLRSYRKKLGELFLEKKFITTDQLHEALEIQKAEEGPLGAILVSQGWVCENDLLQVLGVQLHLSTQTVDPYRIPLEIIAQVPVSVAVRYSVFPLEERGGGLLVLGTDTFLEADEVRQLERELERKVDLVLCTRSELVFALRRGYDRLAMEGASKIIRLGESLLHEKLITQADLQEALRSQKQSYMRLGDILIEQGAIDRRDLEEALSAFSPNEHGLLGSFLVQQDYITLKQLEKALAQQHSSFKRLGDILVEKGLVGMKQLEQFSADDAVSA
jgi:adsorption protein B